MFAWVLSFVAIFIYNRPFKWEDVDPSVVKQRDDIEGKIISGKTVEFTLEFLGAAYPISIDRYSGPMLSNRELYFLYAAHCIRGFRFAPSDLRFSPFLSLVSTTLGGVSPISRRIGPRFVCFVHEHLI